MLSVKQQIERDYKRHITLGQQSIKNDPKEFWIFIRSKKGMTRIPGRMFLDGINISQPQEIVENLDFFHKEYFNKYLAWIHGHSTVTNLCSVTQYISDNLECLRILLTRLFMH
ncbi:hypothetical protein BDFB_009936, partial [Asbolus verrucosus]